MARAQDRHVDSLTMLASSMMEEVPRLMKVELIVEPSINAVIGVGVGVVVAGVDIAMILATGPCWMDPIIDFLVEDRVPNDENEANRIRRMAPRY